MRVIGAETSAALSLGMDWTSTLLLVEVLLAAFASGLVFGLRSEVWSRRSSRGTVSRPASGFHPDTVVAPLAPDAEPGPTFAVPGRVPGAADAGPPKPPMELAVQAQASPPVPTEPHPPGAPAVSDPERHRELYATEYSRQIRRLKRLRRETSDGLSLAAQARPGQESAVQLDDPPIEAPEEGPRD